jgi:hypothetical protein
MLHPAAVPTVALLFGRLLVACALVALATMVMRRR